MLERGRQRARVDRMESAGKEILGVYDDSKAKKARLDSTLDDLLSDPLLADVPKKPSLFDVDTLVSLELGSAMRLSIAKVDGATFDVAVMNSATVKDLKLAIKKKVNDVEQSNMGHRQISWKHVWENFCLAHGNEKMLDDRAMLLDFGIRNNSKVQFVQFITSKGIHKHSKRRKHRFFHGLGRST